ncbi:MAG: adenylate/guanylate cyclase domain-containing protein [Actinomycetota bacterium]
MATGTVAIVGDERGTDASDQQRTSEATGAVTNQRLAPFVCRLTVELAERPGSHWTGLDGSMLSADISGFTALSERLAAKGKAGAEEITVLLNTCFEALIGAAYDYGGEIIKFGGDALLVLYRGEEHERRAANAALAMQRALVSSRAARDANLTMTVGVGTGPFDVFLVGGDHRELLITGRAASRVIELEGGADKGQTLADDHIARFLPARFVVGERAGGRIISGDPEMAQTGSVDRDLGESPLERFVPAAVVEQLDAFADLGGEHRLVTVGFCMVTGIDQAIRDIGAEDVAVALGDLIDNVGRAVDTYGGAALHTDIAEDGFKFVLCAGAPLNTGNTSDSMLRAALEIATHDGPFTIRQGVQTGRAYAGFLGSRYRRTYTLMGDVVNTAARMLGAADHRDVIAVQDVIADTRSWFSSEELPPFTVKGKTEPIVAHRVVGVEDNVRQASPAAARVGGEDELAAVVTAIDQGNDGPGQVVDLTGGPGAGKTRLIEDAIDHVLSRSTVEEVERALFRASAPQFGAGVPYGLARPLLRSGLGIDSFADAAYAGEVLTKVVQERAPDLAPMLPLLALPTGAEVAATPEADAIGEDFRRARMHDVVVELIDRLVPTAAVMIVEDLQWADDGSRQLVEHLAQVSTDRRWTLLISRRPDTEQAPALGDHVIPIALEALTDDQVRRLAVATADEPLSDEALRLIVDRANGNPLFTVELGRAIGRGGDVVPDSVEKLLAARVDSLPPQARRIVRLASVLGTRFRLSTLRAIVDQAEATGLSDPALSGILEATGDNEWAFSQTLFRDAAYEGLPYATRRSLHTRIGNHLEAGAAANIEELAAILAWHFEQGRLHRKTWAYGVLAGDRAMRLSSPVEAIEAYQRALAAGRWPKAVTKRQRSRVASLLGDAAERAGRFDLSAEAYRTARKLLVPGDPDRLPLFRKQGILDERQGRYDGAVRWYQRGLQAASELDHDYPNEPAELAVATAGIRFRQGRYDQCWDAAAGVAADPTNAVAARFRAHYICQLVGTLQGRPETPIHAARAMELAEDFDNPVMVANLYNNLGIASYYAGRWEEAVDLYQRGYELRDASGDIAGSVMSLNNIGEVRSDQQRFAEAEELFTTVVRRSEAAGYAVMIHAGRSNLGRLLGRMGQVDRARELLKAALADFRSQDAAVFAAEVQLRLLEIEKPGRETVEQAQALLAEVADVGAGATVEIPTRRMLAVGLHASGDASAAAEIERSIAMAREEQLNFELALGLAVAATIATAEGRTGDAEEAREEADDLAMLLGIEGEITG